ncbi:MAG TPA: hypothetical protein VFS08_18640 [Gemmatimonadaceae bacterium]|nr:hypothetical protein [Gemmatimonadaceae bacterium]
MPRDDRTESDRQGRRPSDTQQLAGDTPASEPLTSAPRVQPGETEERAHQLGLTPEGAPRSGSTPADRQADGEAEELGHS